MFFCSNTSAQSMFEQLKTDVARIRQKVEPAPVAVICSRYFFRQLELSATTESIPSVEGNSNQPAAIRDMPTYRGLPVYVDVEMIEPYKVLYSVEDLDVFLAEQQKIRDRHAN